MKIKEEMPEIERVRLKPVFGIRPGLYILIGMIFLLIVLSFILFVLPGLVSRGSYVRFDINTKNTAIYMDDRYIGSTEGSIYFLPCGTHEFSFEVCGAYAGSVTEKIPKRIFFTLFRHSIHDIVFKVEKSPEIENAIRKNFIDSLIDYSRILSYENPVAYPPLFTSLAYNALALSIDVTDLIEFGEMNITSKEMYADYIEACDMLSIESNPVLEYLYTDLTEYRTGLLTENPTVAPQKDGDYFLYPGYRIRMGYDTALSYPEVIERRVNVDVNPFEIAAKPVTEYEYAVFVSENPEWSISNIESLIENNLVDENYLRGINLSVNIHSTRPIRSVSYYAALSYCEWLSEKYSLNIVLPTEAEWYTAALSSSGKKYSSSLTAVDDDDSSPSFMLGKVWEMTDTPFVPLSRVMDYEKAIEEAKKYDSSDIIVKGGSYVNQDVSIDTVGVIERNTTSPFIGFRTAIR